MSRVCKHCNEEFTKGSGNQCYPCKNGLERYGINKLEQNILLESQKNCCALCEKPVSLRGNNFSGVVDHNHDTGEVRGVLCGHCNVALGKLETDGRLEAFLKNIRNYVG